MDQLRGDAEIIHATKRGSRLMDAFVIRTIFFMDIVEIRAKNHMRGFLWGPIWTRTILPLLVIMCVPRQAGNGY